MTTQPHLNTEQSQPIEDWTSRNYVISNEGLNHHVPAGEKPNDLSMSSKPLLSDDRSRKSSFVASPLKKPRPFPEDFASRFAIEEKMALGALMRTPKLILPSDAQQTHLSRGRQNWNKLKKIYHALKVDTNLKAFLAKKHKDIHTGKSITDIIVYKSKWSRFKAWYIDPGSKFMVVWGFIFEIGIVYYSLIFPYQLAFGTNRAQLDALNIITDIVDVFFFLDIILTFFVAIRLPDRTLECDKRVIAKNYITGLFLVDIITILPFELFFDKMSFIKMLRAIHLGRFFGHMNQFADLVTPIFVQGLQVIKIADFIGSITTTFLALAIIFHYCACIWILMGFKTEPHEKTWFDNITTYYDIDNDGMLITGSFDIYVCSLVHVAQTLTTVGYGSYFGYAAREYIFSMFILFFGTILFTFVFEKIKSIVVAYNEADRREQKETQDLNSWLKRIDWNIIDHKDIINDALLDEMKDLLNYRIDEDWQKYYLNNPQFKKLDYFAAHKILDFGLSKFKKKFYILFQELSDEFVHRILAQSDSRYFVPGELIVERGRRPKGIYLILRGSILLAGPTKYDYFTRLGQNSFFGEISMASERKSPIFFIAETEVNCLFISKEVFTHLNKFPDDLAKLRALAFFRYKHFLYQKHVYLKEQKQKKSSDEGFSNSSIQMLQPLTSDKQGDLLSPPDMNSAVGLGIEHNTELQLLSTPERTDDRFFFNNMDRAKSPIEDLTSGQKNEELGLIYISPKKKKKKQNKITKTLEKIMSLDESDIELAQNSSESDIADYYDDDKSEDSHHEAYEEVADYEEEEDEEDEDLDVLNSSDIYPLEVNSTFTDITKEDNYTQYLEERVVFIAAKLKKLKRKFHTEVQYTLRRQQAINRKLILAGVLGGPFGLIAARQGKLGSDTK